MSFVSYFGVVFSADLHSQKDSMLG